MIIGGVREEEVGGDGRGGEVEEKRGKLTANVVTDKIVARKDYVKKRKKLKNNFFCFIKLIDFF